MQRLIEVSNVLQRCKALSLKFQQKDLDTAAWDEVQTGQQMDYAFDEPLLPHKVRVVLSDNGFLDQSVHEYPLDIIKVCSAISHNLPGTSVSQTFLPSVSRLHLSLSFV